MQDSASVAAASSAGAAAPRAMSVAPQDSLFIALLNGYRRSGGLQRISALQTTRRNAWKVDLIEALPTRVAEREVLGIMWNGVVWVPGFQFGRHGDTKPAAAAVFLELRPSHDPWELATWLVTPCNWLRQDRPIDLLDTTPGRVLEAARTDRYIAKGW